MSLLYPHMQKDRVTDISADELQALGVRGLLLDIDNTLTTHYSQELSEKVADWIADMRAAGIRMTVISNAKRHRVEPFAEKIGMSCVWLAAKPLPFGMWRGVRRLGLRRRECMAVGDQTFTDTLGARLAGVRCVQLMPIQLELDKPFLMFKRRLEKPILARYKKRRERV